MQAVITVFKTELKGKGAILDSIIQMSSEFKELGDAIIFSPRPGRLFELLNLLKNQEINYGTHFNVMDDYSKSENVK